MEFEHERKERERREKKKQEDIAYQKRDAEWRKRQEGKKTKLAAIRKKFAQEDVLKEMSTYNFEEDQPEEEEKGWYTEGGQKRQTSKYEAQSSNYLKSMNSMNKNDSGKAFGKFGNAREQQMQEAMKKKRNLDFNVENYDIEELAAILKFQHIPLNKTKNIGIKTKIPKTKSLSSIF